MACLFLSRGNTDKMKYIILKNNENKFSFLISQKEEKNV